MTDIRKEKHMNEKLTKLRNILQRFSDKVEVTDSCWIWTGAANLIKQLKEVKS